MNLIGRASNLHSWRGPADSKLTLPAASDRMSEFGRVLSAWLGGQSQGKYKSGRASSGVPVSKGRGRAETPLLDLVRTGIENDFERVVFPKYPELREVKRVLERCRRGLCLAVRLRLGDLWVVCVSRGSRESCSSVARRRHPGSGYDHADAPAVLEQDFRLKISDCRF